MEKHYKIATKADWHRVASLLLKQAGKCHIWCFEGEPGAGKTTLIQALCRCLGVQEAVTSPTFSLVHEYTIPQGKHVYHLDLYRLKEASAALDIGLEDYLTAQAYVFIEWPAIISPLLPLPYFAVQICTASLFCRNITAKEIT